MIIEKSFAYISHVRLPFGQMESKGGIVDVDFFDFAEGADDTCRITELADQTGFFHIIHIIFDLWARETLFGNK